MIFKQNIPQHPDVYVHYLKSDLTAYWLNRALGLLHCRGKTPRTTPVYTSHTVAMEKIYTDGFRARLWPHSAHTRAMCFTLHISQMIAFPSPKIQNKSLMGSRPWGITEGNSSHFIRSWAQSHAVLLNGLFFFFYFFCTEHSRCLMRRDHSILT